LSSAVSAWRRIVALATATLAVFLTDIERRLQEPEVL
jgi:hypothetical protein